jgi:hypothetical protein
LLAANLIITVIQFEPVVTGFSSHLVSGKVFNRGLTTAANVIVKYQVRDTIQDKGKTIFTASTTDKQILVMFSPRLLLG